MQERESGSLAHDFGSVFERHRSLKSISGYLTCQIRLRKVKSKANS